MITEGTSTLNTSALTGESLPRDAKAGDEVISGCINMTGLLKIRTTKEFGESTVSKILELVENSSSRKSKSENFISKFAKYYTPAVCYGALALAFIPPYRTFLFWETYLVGRLESTEPYLLVISCPCALVISIPLSFFAGIGGASNQGVLVKGSNYLETLSQTKIVVFDKTGTMTKGVFEVSGIHHNEMEDAKLLEYAAYAECSSSHPISKSLQKAYASQLTAAVSQTLRNRWKRCYCKGGRCVCSCRQREADEPSWYCVQRVPSCRNGCPYGCGWKICRSYPDF